VIELPLAAIAVLTVRRMLRTTFAVMRKYQGESGPVLRLRKIPLVGAEPGRPLSDLFAGPVEHAGELSATKRAA